MGLPGPRSPFAHLKVGVGMLRAPAETIRALHQRYGEVAAFGYRPYRYVALFGPEANRYVLADNSENFRWREALKSLIPVDGDTALVVTDGEEHRRRRRLVQPAFATSRINSYLDVMVDEADRALDTWVPGRRLDAYAELQQAILRIAVRTLFGDTLGERAGELGAALSAAIEFVNLPISMQVKIDLPWTRWHRAKAARDRADAIVNAEIARRRARGETSDSGDVLDRLLATTDDEGGSGLTDVELRDQVVSLVAAGFDTTSGTAGWAVRELLVNPEAWKRAAAEVAAVVGGDRLTTGHHQRMPYLDAVVHETLRLWPAGFVSARKAVDDFEFAGHRIPGGSMVLYSPYATQRMPEHWPEPDRFLPERWLDGEPAPYTFVPFGGGYRRCIGFAFATQELKALLVQLLRRIELTYDGPAEVVPEGNAAMHPKGGVPVRVTEARRVTQQFAG
jgi:cytochrome P450